MKKKIVLAVAATCSALALGGVLIGTNGALPLVQPVDGASTSKSITFSASDFAAGAGDITKFGQQFHYSSVTLNGTTISIGSTGIFYNMAYAGITDTNGLKGSGFESISFTGLSVTAASGYVHTFDKDAANGHLYALSGKSGSYTIDLTKDADGTTAVDGKNRTRFQIEMGAESNSIAFASVTLTYGCRTLVPSVSLSAAQAYVQMGKTLAVTATPSEIGTATPTYTWTSSNTSVFTVAGSGDSATVTPVAVGTANVTVKMTVDAVDYTTGLAIEVKAAGLLGTGIGTLADLEAAFDGAGGHTANSYYLTADIDCAGWAVPNNGMAGDYTGTFDGNGHKLTNVAVKNGLFNNIGSSGVVNNLDISGTFAPVGDGFGFVAFQNNGTISNSSITVYPSATHAGALSATAFNGSGVLKDLTVKAYFALDVKEGAFFADTCQASIVPTGTNVGTFYNKAATTSENKSTLIQSKGAFTITDGGTW
jgi:hypothetical protein